MARCYSRSRAAASPQLERGRRAAGTQASKRGEEGGRNPGERDAPLRLRCVCVVQLPVRELFPRARVLSSLPLCPWKMNLLAASHDARALFIASGSTVVMLPLSAAGVPRTIEAQVAERGQAASDEADSDEIDEAPSHAATTGAASNPAAAAAPSADRSSTAEIVAPRSNDDVATLFHTLSLPSPTADADAAGAAVLPAAPPEINTLRVGWLGNRAVLAATSMAGHSALWDLDRLGSSVRFGEGSTLANARSGADCPDADWIHLNLRKRWDDNSAWSVAMTPKHTEKPVVITGSNARCAFLWRPFEKRPEEGAGEDAAASGPLPPRSDSTSLSSTIPAGHNVPSVDVSSCGRFVALSCIDGIVRIVRLDGSDGQPTGGQGEYFAQRALDSEWGWCVRFVRPQAVSTWMCTFNALQAHHEHAPLPPHIESLRPFAADAPVGPAAHPLLDAMVEQLMGEVGPELNAADAALLRVRLREQIAHILQRQRRGDEDDDEEDDEEDHDAPDLMDDEDAGDAEQLEDDEEEDLEEDGEEDDGAEDAEADDASAASVPEADAVAHDEMGWEAGFEAAEVDDSGQAHSSAEASTHSDEHHAAAMDDSAAASSAVTAATATTTSATSSEPAMGDSRETGTGTAAAAASTADSAAIPLANAADPTTAADADAFVSPDPPLCTPVRAFPSGPAPLRDLLLYSSKLHLYLLDSSLSILASVRHVCAPTLTVHRQLDRLVYLEVIEPLRLIVVGSSASDRLLLYRIDRFACGRYELSLEAALPAHGCGVPIRGVAVVGVPSEPPPQPQASETLAAELDRRQAGRAREGAPPPLQTATPPLPQADRWRVYILYADQRMTAFEVARTTPKKGIHVHHLFAP